MERKIWRIIPLMVLLFVVNACSKEEATGITEKFTQISQFTGESYDLTVFYPDGQFPESPVPVILLLDGFWHYDAVSELLEEKSEAGEIPKCILVSLDYTDGKGSATRMKDLVYPVNEYVEEGVRGDLFYRFITEELFPEIEDQYNSDTTKRTIMGHSLGGFFVLYSLLDNAPEPFFKKSIAASCSMGIGNNYLFVKERETADLNAGIRQKLFMGCGNLAGEAPALHQEFFEKMKSRRYSGLRIDFEIYDATHGTDAYPTFANGLTYIFHHD